MDNHSIHVAGCPVCLLKTCRHFLEDKQIYQVRLERLIQAHVNQNEKKKREHMKNIADSVKRHSKYFVFGIQTQFPTKDCR